MRTILIACVAIFVSSAVSAQEAQQVPAGESASAPASDSAPPADIQPVRPAPPTNPSPDGAFVTISTSMGDITIQLYSTLSPKGSANFLRYVREKHFDGTAIYRVAKGFVVQMGSFTASNDYRPPHAPIPLEANNGLSNLRGTVAYAHGDDPGDGGQAEFFINLRDNTGLDQAKDDTENKSGYAVFGQVVAGMDVVDQISDVPVGDNGPMPGVAPVTPIVVKKVALLPTGN